MTALPSSITVFTEKSGSHLQGIAIDRDRKYLYCSFTTCLIKYDLQGNLIGSVTGLAGHLGCLAYNDEDGMIYGSLEYKHDKIGQGIVNNIGYTESLQDGFYIARFDPDKITGPDMDARNIMEAVFLKEVLDDYAAPGHRYGCSGIDGLTFAPSFEDGTGHFLYVAYGIYGDTGRCDNDYQVLLKYDISLWNGCAQALDQKNMHTSGPAAPDGKYFVYTGNTTYGIQNLEYDPWSNTMVAAVYRGKKEQFPNYPMFFIDCAVPPKTEPLKGIGISAPVLSLTDFHGSAQICGSEFPLGSTGIAALGDGRFYIAQSFRTEQGYGGTVRLYRFDREKLTFCPEERP